jgi:S1-C subfamily serine protease
MRVSAQSCTSEPFLSTRYRGLLMIAVLAGMAAAAGFVLFHSMRVLHDPLHANGSSTSTPSAKPSAFGAVVRNTDPPDVKLTAAEIAKTGNRAIVTVTGYDADEKPIVQGAGYMYSASGIVVTSYSAIRGASSVVVESASGEELNVIALMGYNTNRDLAALAVLEGSLPSLESGAGEVVELGDAVVAMGPDGAVSEGTAGPRRAVGGVDLIQISAKASLGWPVLNQHGKVIGMATRKRAGGSVETFAIPSSYISDLLAEGKVISFAQMLEETQGATAAARQSGQ